ncbi:hypothetical protein BCR34DRAFT_571106 [Clohesyomyces aquaticus]|uniref:Uncharacterized protein n=1 Tax=Clohesyomyces aquaticus TaxID=1231657 RepID=A0A1Y1ZAE4_9PLEO|nr:hypothetical protein BCR34DRAFT_571106 [Clohesyomyces aquaticus]
MGGIRFLARAAPRFAVFISRLSNPSTFEHSYTYYAFASSSHRIHFIASLIHNPSRRDAFPTLHNACSCKYIIYISRLRQSHRLTNARTRPECRPRSSSRRSHNTHHRLRMRHSRTHGVWLASNKQPTLELRQAARTALQGNGQVRYEQRRCMEHALAVFG